MTIGLEPLTIVEIDVPFCIRTFGTLPCTATLTAIAPNKCFNSRATCVVPAVYSATPLTLRFAKNQSGLPRVTVFPALVSVSERPGRINLSGIDPATTALGQRARVTITLQDFTYHDTLTDKYQDERISGAAQFSGVGYKPGDRGTFFAKLLARQPYLIGAALRVKRGYVGQAIASMATSNYVISETPTINAAGRVEIVAKDILDLAENAKAKAPAPSAGKVAANITAGASTLTLDPPGAGAAGYPASGRVCCGREVMTFTRVGDVLTLTGRGVDGTTAEAHEAGDQVQLVLRYVNQAISDVVQDLLVTYAGVPTAFIDLAAWQDEEGAWMSLPVTATITRPTGVSGLVGELCQLGVMIWWDEVAQLIRFRANRPLGPGESFLPLNDDAHIIEGTTEINGAEDQRISTLEFWHGMIDPTDSPTSNRNYSKLTVATLAQNLYGQSAIKTIYTRWLGASGNDATAGVITERLLDRYKDTPKQISFEVDVKDRDTVDLANLITVTSYLLTDATGAAVATPMQVNSITPRDGRVKVECESYTITGRFGFYMQDVAPTYDTTATAQEQAEGAFYMDDTIGTFPDGTGPYVYF